jgi:hypothetical protein
VINCDLFSFVITRAYDEFHLAVAVGATGDGQPFFIKSTQRRKRILNGNASRMSSCEAMACIVLGSRDQASYRKDAAALREVLKTFAYLEPKTEPGAQ